MYELIKSKTYVSFFLNCIAVELLTPQCRRRLHLFQLPTWHGQPPLIPVFIDKYEYLYVCVVHILGLYFPAVPAHCLTHTFRSVTVLGAAYSKCGAMPGHCIAGTDPR